MGHDWDAAAAVRTVPVIEKSDNKMLDPAPLGCSHVLAREEGISSCHAYGPSDPRNGFSPCDIVKTTGLVYCPQSAVMEHGAATCIPRQP